MYLCIFPQGQEGFCFVGLDLSQDIHQVQVRSVKHIPHHVLNSAIVGFTSPPYWFDFQRVLQPSLFVRL